ncbi:MAG: zinc metallopeptidase [Bacteroidia bacterium]|nr:zinc metallopeptidase [Bacteroidia bacterium]
MRWQGRKQSSNVEDRRGGGGARTGTGIGIGTIVIAIIIWILGGNPMSVLQNAGSSGTSQAQPSAVSSEQEDQLAAFVKVVLQDTEDVWNKIYPQATGRAYRNPVLVIYTGSVQSACGMGSAAAGPFYCPGDEKLYIDLSFYNELSNRFGASGDFAMAYVVAHEVGHHVQNLLGATAQVDAQRGRLPKAQFNDLSVRLELQADFYAGVWAHHNQNMNNILEEGDLEEALRAANAIGDDNLQKQAQGYAVPESFTHGTSAQRMRWFKLGFDTGDLRQGDTFSARQL